MATARVIRNLDPPTYWLTRFLILRLLGLVYFVAFLSLVNQVLPLIGRNGLLPAVSFLARLESQFGIRVEGFVRVPSLFWLDASDPFLLAMAYLKSSHLPNRCYSCWFPIQCSPTC